MIRPSQPLADSLASSPSFFEAGLATFDRLLSAGLHRGARLGGQCHCGPASWGGGSLWFGREAFFASPRS